MFPQRRLPPTPAHHAGRPSPSPDAFFLCPVVCLPPVPEASRLQQQALYEWAFRQAQEVVKPSLPERDLLAVWN